jgi:hypothetical protein
MRNSCNVLIGKHEEKRPFGTPMRTWKDNIKMDLMEIHWEGVQ